MTTRYDVLVVGAGMAGASIAAELGPYRSVLVGEAEDRPGYHATGRSAAFWTESYGGPKVQPLTTASGPYLEAHGFLASRGALTLARADQLEALAAFRAEFADSGVRMLELDRAALETHVPGLADDIIAGVWEPDCCDIDVAGLHAHYLGEAKRAGAQIRSRAPLTAAAWDGTHWQAELGGETVSADVLVDAAGAWADRVADMAGVAPIGIQPYRRTVAQLRTDPPAPADLPLTLGIAGDFYFKPDNGRLWLSPHDETPVPPGDAAAEEYDVALAIDRFQHVVDWRIEAVEHRWAGLRSFAPDRLPVIGFAPGEPRFFWFAGQGGFGIQTAPAAAKLGAALLLGREPDPALSGVRAALYDPARFFDAP